MKSQNKRYGKIKNGNLILAARIVRRDNEIYIDDEELYTDNGYKPVEYKAAPENRDGFNLISEWKDEGKRIVQDWAYQPINEDYSFKLVQAIGSFCEKNVELRNGVEKNYENNTQEIQNIIHNNALLELIYNSNEEKLVPEVLIELLHKCELDLPKFLDELRLTDKMEKYGYTVYGNYLLKKTEELVENDVIKWLGEKYDMTEPPEEFVKNPKVKMFRDAIVYPQEIKYPLHKIWELEDCATLSNQTTYYMSFIYMFTLFDEVLLKTIRLICMHEKKWLISSASILASDVLDCKTTDELHMKLVDKKIEELAWGSYLDKLNFLESKGIIIDGEHTKLFREKILYLSQKRNAMVHNEGLWNASIKRNLKDTEYFDKVIVGGKVDTSLEGYKEASVSVQQAVDYLYKRICDKFNLLFRIDVNYHFKLEGT